MGFSTFCIKLCGAAANATVDHAAAVQRAISGQPPDPQRLPRLAHQAVLSVTVLDAADLPSSALRGSKRPSTLAWLSGGSGDSSKSSGGPVVEVWVSSTKNPARRKVTKPGQRSSSAEGQASNDAGGPTFVFGGTGQTPGGKGSVSGVSVFSFPVPKPHEEHLLLSVHMSPDAGAAAASGGAKSGSLPLVGRGQVPLSHVSSVAHDLEVPLETSAGGYGGTVRVRACLRALSDPAATDRAVFNDGASTFLNEREAALVDQANAASMREVYQPSAAPPQSLGRSVIRPSMSGSSSASVNHSTSGGNGSADDTVTEEESSPRSGVGRMFGGMRSKSLKTPPKEEKNSSSAGRRSSISFFSSSASSKSDKSNTGSWRRSEQQSPRGNNNDDDDDDETSAELAAAADDVARRVAASAKRKLAQGIVSREEYECIMAQNQALYESETSDAALGLATGNGDESAAPKFAEKGGGASTAGGRARPACSSIDRPDTGSSLSDAVGKLAVSDAWEVFGEGCNNGDEMGMYLAPTAVEVLSPRDVSRRYEGGGENAAGATSTAGVAFDSALPYETSGAARAQKMPANEVAQLKSMGFDPVAVDAAAEVKLLFFNRLPSICKHPFTIPYDSFCRQGLCEYISESTKFAQAPSCSCVQALNRKSQALHVHLCRCTLEWTSPFLSWWTLALRQSTARRAMRHHQPLPNRAHPQLLLLPCPRCRPRPQRPAQ